MPTAARPMAMDCGLIILPIPAPMTFAAASHAGSAPMRVAVIACIPPNRTQVLVPLPVINAPSTPISGETSGKKLPVWARSAEMSEVIPLWSMIFAQATTQQIVKTVFQLETRVLFRTLPMVPMEAFWIRPPMNAAMKISTPGVLTQAKVSFEAPSSG